MGTESRPRVRVRSRPADLTADRRSTTPYPAAVTTRYELVSAHDGGRCDEQVADLAWPRTLAFLAERLE